MATATPRRRSLAGRVAIISRHAPDSPDLPSLRTELAAEHLAEHIERVVAAAPPLSPEQRDRLASLLYGAPRAAASGDSTA